MKVEYTKLHGRTACPGRVSGKPRIVYGVKDLADIKEGDVLIARETCIEFVPAMQRAGAIITETGGRFCHAAVWARENQKPTIVQVESATAILAGHESVLVDADSGTVVVEA